jgi:hypothetical protein
VPATFVVHSGGKLTPPQISVPGSLPIQLTVISRDGHSHHVALGSPAVKLLRVPSAGQARILIPHLRNGHYSVKLDGSNAGTLVVGVAVGP